MARRGEDREAEGLVESAAEAYQAGDFEAALARAEEALGQDRRSVPALHVRAAALAALGRIEEALEAYERALGRGKDDLDLLYGAADFHLGDLQEGEEDREALERGLELARRGGKLARKAGDPELAADFAWLEGVGLNQLGEPAEALSRLDEAVAALPDAADVRRERGLALYELTRFEEAWKELLRAEKLDRDDPWTQHDLGLVAERRGDPKEAERRFRRARKLSPGEFPEPVRLSHEEFDQVVEDALAELPEQVRRYLANVPVTVEEIPSDEDLRGAHPPLSPSILGLFRGAPHGQKSSMDPWSHFPSGIVLYQRNLERFARTREELVREIGVTLVHEVGHFLGLDEEELWERGLE
jgi:predicted Zn-dependent protease with MMP-like domain/Flp pilus assembly protein TadD